MKRYLILFFLCLALCPSIALAQSSMSDQQIMQYIVSEHEKGTSQQQIVIKLMQRGVNVTDIQRVRRKYERQMKESGLGQKTDSSLGKDASRLREPNGKTKDEDKVQKASNMDNYSNYRVQPETTYSNTYDENDPDFLKMQQELGYLVPMDSTEMLRQLLRQQELKRNEVFGRNIFNNKNLTFEPSMNIATPQNYRLGPGDAVIIDIYGASEKTINSTVSPDGDIFIEGVGPVSVSGLTVAQANQRIRAKVSTRYSSSSVKISLGQTRTITVNVMGEVKTPGTYTLSAFSSVFAALYMAGGTNDLGTLRNIKIYRQNRLVSVCDIYDYILNGKMTGNVRLADGDVIIVGPYDCLVRVEGKVKRPMIYEMKKNESLGTLLKYAGGFTGDAYRNSVRLVRKTGREFSVYNVGEFDMNSFHLADGDSVNVDSIMHRYANTVELKGSVFRPGMYQIGGDINSVRTLLQQADGVKEDAFTAHAVMHRMKADRTLEVIPVDVEGIMNGTVPDIPLKENDVLFIPTRSDMQQQQTITIHGEVNYPGIYQYAANETIEDFILQAGGLTDKASTVKVDVARRVNNPKALRNDSLIAQTFSFSLKDGFVIDGKEGFTLQPFDEVYVRKSPGTSVPRNVFVEGQVMFAGAYTMTKTETRLSDVIRSAGGPNSLAFVEGAKVMRAVNAAERERMEAIIKDTKQRQQKDLLKLATKNNSSVGQLAEALKAASAENLQIPNYYPVGIQLDKALAHPGSDEDIVLREGDRIIVPEYTGTVKINGEVLYPNSVGFVKGKSAKYYIDKAGGFTSDAKKSQAYIIYMNGMTERVDHNAKIRPGCEIVVPAKSASRTSLADTLAISSGFASIATMIATIANLIK